MGKWYVTAADNYPGVKKHEVGLQAPACKTIKVFFKWIKIAENNIEGVIYKLATLYPPVPAYVVQCTHVHGVFDILF